MGGRTRGERAGRDEALGRCFLAARALRWDARSAIWMVAEGGSMGGRTNGERARPDEARRRCVREVAVIAWARRCDDE